MVQKKIARSLMHYHFQMPSLTHTFYASAYIIVGGEHYVFGLSLWPSVSACVHLSSRCPLTPVPLDTISACCVEGFEWNLAQVFIMWMGIVEKVFRVRG